MFELILLHGGKGKGVSPCKLNGGYVDANNGREVGPKPAIRTPDFMLT